MLDQAQAPPTPSNGSAAFPLAAGSARPRQGPPHGARRRPRSADEVKRRLAQVRGGPTRGRSALPLSAGGAVLAPSHMRRVWGRADGERSALPQRRAVASKPPSRQPPVSLCPSSPSSRPPGRLACVQASTAAGTARGPVTPQTTNQAARSHLQTTSLSSAYGVS